MTYQLKIMRMPSLSSEWLGPLTFSLYAFGYMLGTPLLGGMSDARGRKLVIFSCLMATITFNQMGAMTERSGMSFSARIDAISIDIH